MRVSAYRERLPLPCQNTSVDYLPEPYFIAFLLKKARNKKRP
jgi:hypothetical protein